MILTVCLVFLVSRTIAQPNSFDRGKSKPLSSPGNVACGPVLDPLHFPYASLGPAHYTTSNPNTDPVCGQCIEVSSKGQTINVPVFDKCMECQVNDVYLSAAVFQQLANSKSAWQIDNVSWKFAPCPPPVTTPTPPPTEKPIAFDGNGQIYWYSTPGISACGGFVNASQDFTVLVSDVYFDKSKANPNNDPICGKCIQADFINGNSVNVVIKDRCVGCPDNKIMLSLPAMTKLRGNWGLDNIDNGSWKMAPCV